MHADGWMEGYTDRDTQHAEKPIRAVMPLTVFGVAQVMFMYIALCFEFNSEPWPNWAADLAASRA